MKVIKTSKQNSILIDDDDYEVNTKTKFLGYYTDPKEAAKVYNQNATKYFGEFAHLNGGLNENY